MNDSDILRLIRESPAKGHRALFDEYYNYVRAITLRILRNYGSEDDINDCVIDTFTDILLNVDSGREGSLKAYIGTTAKNKAISLQRSLKRRNAGSVPLDDDTMNNIPSTENIEEASERSEVTQRLIQEIRLLGKPDSDIIIHKYFYDRNSREIGSILGLSPAAVRMKCSRAMKKLRKAMTDLQ